MKITNILHVIYSDSTRICNSIELIYTWEVSNYLDCHLYEVISENMFNWGTISDA